jgi:hypothetical protein
MTLSLEGGIPQKKYISVELKSWYTNKFTPINFMGVILPEQTKTLILEDVF